MRFHKPNWTFKKNVKQIQITIKELELQWDIIIAIIPCHIYQGNIILVNIQTFHHTT